MDNNLSLLNKKVDLLKQDVQDLIDKIKIEKDDNKKKNMITSKDIFLKELDNALSSIKNIKTNEKSLNRAIRANNTIKYHRKSNITELIQEQTENREKAINIFQEKQELKNNFIHLEKEYLCNKYPGFLFFDKNILHNYKPCPFIFPINSDTSNNRKEWLIKYNKHELYTDLYESLVNKAKLNQELNNKKDIESFFIKIHDSFNNEHKDLLNSTVKYIQEYNLSKIKTKKLKQYFNFIINNCSILVNLTNYKIHEFLSLHYNIHIPINQITKNKNYINVNIMNTKLYDDYLIKYKQIIDDIENTHKYINNTINKLNDELYEYIYKISTTKKIFKQQGNYFKKWSLLNKEEKINRFNSYSEFYVNKLIESNIITTLDLELILKLQKLLINEFDNIKYKYLKWNSQLGIIENINCLHFDNQTNIFSLLINNEISNKNKPISTRSILNKQNTNIINEELMIYLIILKKQNKLINENIKELKSSFLENIKDKLKLKRILIHDRQEIYKKFDEIFHIVYNNDSSV